MALFGRSDELAEVEVVLDEARVAGRILFIEGEGGIGKTRLVDEAVARVQGFTVLRGACEELEQGRAFGPLVQALAPHIATLPSEDGHAGVESILEVLEAIASSRPVALVLEDMHWADHATLRTMLAIGRTIEHFRLALVGTLRPSPRNDELVRLVERLPREATRRLLLGPLDDGSVRALAGEVAGAPPSDGLARELRGTAGNPLYVVELIEALRDDGALHVADGRAEARTTQLPPTLRRAILRRLSFLPEPTLEVLRIASVLGSSFLPGHLSVVTKRPVVDLLSSLHEAMEAALITERQDRLAFRHDLIREAIYSDLPEPLRRALHLEAGGALADAGESAELVAEHLALGARGEDPEAIATIRRTAIDLVYTAPQASVRLLERVQELVGEDDLARDAVGAELILPLELVGRRADARRLGAEIVARGPDRLVEYTVRRSIAYSSIVAGDPAPAVDHYRVVTADRFAPEWTETGPGAHAIDLGNLAVALFLAGDVDAAGREAERAVSVAEKTGFGLAVILAALPQSFLARVRGDVRRSVAIARRMVDILDTSASAYGGNGWPHWELGQALIDADELDEAVRVLRAGLRIASRQGRGSQVPMYQVVLARALLLQGSWEQAEVEAEVALAAADDADVYGDGSRRTGHVAPSVASVFAFVAYHRGDLTLAAKHLDSVDPVPGLGFHLLLPTRALLVEAQGKPGALDAMFDLWTLCVRWGYFWEWRSMGPALVRFAVGSGERGRGEAVTAFCEQGAQAAGDVASAQGSALHCRGLLDSDPEVLMAAVAAHRRGPRPFDLALACEDAAIGLARSERRKEAETLFDEALDIHGRLGSVRDAARVTAAMRDVGIRRGTRGPRVRPKSGWESLTPTELEVVGLVALGLTNRQIAERQFVSRYTVESHLRHVFQKLGMSSRVELAAEAARLGKTRHCR